MMIEPERITFPYLHETGAHVGRPLRNRRENTAALLAAHGATVRYNMMLHQLEVRFEGLEVAEERAGNTSLAWLRSMARKHGLTPNNVTEDIETLADEYHPALEWIDGIAWDGIDRMGALVATVKTVDPLAETLIRTWLLQCAAALVSPPGFRPEGVLTMQGPQGCGKTQWIRMLVPEDAPAGLVQIGRSVDPANRDSVEQATSSWLCELGEVDATFRRSDIAALKAFLDLDYDRFRAAYARVSERRPRRTVFYASVNRPDFLADTTGNRRWWAVQVQSCDWRHGLPMRQVWAQVVAQVRAGVDWRLGEPDRLELVTSNERFEVAVPLADEIWAAWVTDDTGQWWASISEVCASIGVETGSTGYARTAREAGQILSNANVERKRKRLTSGARTTAYAVRRAGAQ